MLSSQSMKHTKYLLSNVYIFCSWQLMLCRTPLSCSAWGLLSPIEAKQQWKLPCTRWPLQRLQHHQDWLDALKMHRMHKCTKWAAKCYWNVVYFSFFCVCVCCGSYIQVSCDDSSITRYINEIKAPGYRGLGLIKECNEINLHLEQGWRATGLIFSLGLYVTI